jgi:tRNA(Ile)-lysidine synthase TilS/MesJ
MRCNALKMKCDKCSAGAIIHQRYSGMSLCRMHFYEDVHRKIRETIRESGIFGHEAKIAVALNGGAESLVLIHVLKSLFLNRMDIELFAITVDEGIEGYRPKSIECARRTAEKLEVPFTIKAFSDAFGTTIDEVAAAREPCYKEPCGICEAGRNELLNRAAIEVGANAVATAHSLDAEAGEIMLRYLRGHFEGWLKQDAKSEVPVIRPLRRIPAKETRLYAKTRGLPFNRHSCPYACGMRWSVRRELRGFEIRHPGTNYSLQSSILRMKDHHASRDEEGQSL